MSMYDALPPQNFLEGTRSTRKNRFTVVGYGLEGYIKPFYEEIYERHPLLTRAARPLDSGVPIASNDRNRKQDGWPQFASARNETRSVRRRA